MSVWFCIPSARPAAEANKALQVWRDRGYKICLWRDNPEPAICDVELRGPYPGYPSAINACAKWVMENDPSCDWVVSGGDDTLPDEKYPLAIAAECTAHFKGTFGVMQPTGDRWGGGSIDRIAGSPWMGREWCERAYGGLGPCWGEYGHMFSDEELQEVATKLGVFWQRPDLTHHHAHFLRNGDAVVKATPPAHLKQWNTPEHWNSSKALFESRRAAGFPGHQPLEIGAMHEAVHR
jgi:hypothetical protein